MTRFLTSEDVRRANSRVIEVEEGTIVTPQAQDTAREMGVVVQTRGGTYREPAPSRGPDAAFAQRSLPHLPEPPAEGELASFTGVVVTAAGKNRPGVLSELTGALANSKANILDISQKVVEGYFHIVLMVELPPGSGFAQLKGTLECMGGPDDYVVRVMHERVFRFMHRV
ncbi:MAG: ACT domain-containing protein [Planctomycetaceae bacterium]|nr:ACT domain-containing protein [Planctomycetaceae bacterium]